MITFIIPAYNSEKTITQCIKSILSQKAEKEIIVVDNNSTDNTAVIVKEYPVRYFFEPKRGPASARNKGLSEVSNNSKFIGFIDADVVLPDKNWANRVILLLEKYKKVAAVGGPAKSQKSNYISNSLESFLFGKSFSREHYVRTIATMNAVYKKVAIDKLKFDEDFIAPAGEDTDFNLRLLKLGHKILFSPKLWVYHDHPLNLKQLCRKWYNYGKFYPLPYFENRLYSLGFVVRLFFLPMLALFFIFTFYYVIFKYIFIITLLGLPFCYLMIGIKVKKTRKVLIFTFIHTVKQYSQLLGIWVGIIKRLLRKSKKYDR